MKLVLNYSPGSFWNDLPEDRYHFPQQYLRQIEQAVKDRVIYYRLSGEEEPRGYFATALVDHIAPDPAHPERYYAEMKHYLDFGQTVPVYENNIVYESERPCNPNGQPLPQGFQRSVRNLSDEDYNRIFAAGVKTLLTEYSEHYDSFIPNLRTPTDKVYHLTAQKEYRDRMFALHVKKIYKNTCAVTGLHMINGGGLPEVQAAHIRPVSKQGPDSIRNGIALCGTAHWMFDRGLITISDDYKVLISSRATKDVKRLILPELNIPQSMEQRPHEQFLHYHRENIFKE